MYIYISCMHKGQVARRVACGARPQIVPAKSIDYKETHHQQGQYNCPIGP